MFPLLMMIGLLGNQENLKEKEVLELVSNSIKANYGRAEHFYAKIHYKTTNFTIKEDSIKEFQQKDGGKAVVKYRRITEFVLESTHSKQDFFQKKVSTTGELLGSFTKNKEICWDFISDADEVLKKNVVWKRTTEQMPSRRLGIDLRDTGISWSGTDFLNFIKNKKVKSVEEKKDSNGSKIFEVSVEYSGYCSNYYFDSSVNYLPKMVVFQKKDGGITMVQKVEYTKVAENCWFPSSSVRLEKIKPVATLEEFEKDKTGYKTETITTVKEFKVLKESEINNELFDPVFPKGTEIKDAIKNDTYLQE